MKDFTPPPVPEWVPALDGFWGDPVDGGLGNVPPKVLAARLVSVLPGRAARAFAAMCARRVLPVFEALDDYRNDGRPRQQVALGERYAFGRAELDELDEDEGRWESSNAAYDDDLDIWNNVGPASRRLRAAATAASAAVYAIEPERDVSTAVGYAADVAGVGERLAQARLLWLSVPPPGPPPAGAAAELAAAWLDEWFRTGADDRVCRAALADALEESGTPHDSPRLRALREMTHWHPGLWPMTPPPLPV